MKPGTQMGDRFYECIVAGIGLSGQLRLVAYDPQISSRSTPAPSGMAVQGKAWLKQDDDTGKTTIVTFNGTWKSNGDIDAKSDDGWTIGARTSDNEIKGSLTDKDGYSSNIAGQDISKTRAVPYCGVFDGDDSGTWNLVVAESGSVKGAFSYGSITGSASKDDISLSWAGRIFAQNYSGTASGKISSAGTVEGDWSGAGDKGMKVSGSWNGGVCSRTTGAPELETQTSSCSCSKSGCCPVANKPDARQCCL